MADMILGGAQGAVDSLLGRLTSALVDEAQLLSGVRSDVQFIKDEMESMNGFLLHIAEADEEDHQVGAWMKQVAEVAYASQNSVDQYIQSIGAGRREPGLLGYLRRLPKLVCTLPRRHRIANQIRELKIRSCEVGERRMRYDVKVPERDRDRANVRKAGWQASGDDDTNGQEDARRRGWVDPYFSPKHCEIDLFRLDHGGQNSLKVIAVVGMGGTGKSHGAGSFYQSHFGRDSFDCKAWICLGQESTEAVAFLGKVLAALDIPSDQFDSEPAQPQPNEKEEMIGQPQPKEKEELIAQLQLNKEEELIAQPEPNEDEELIAQLEELIAPFQQKEKEELIAELQPIEKLKFFRRKEKLKCIAHPQLMETEELIAQLRLHLKDKRYLLVIDDVRDKYLWNHIKSAFPHENCSPGSTILITTRSSDVAKSFSPTETLDLDTGSHVYLRSAMHLMNINNQSDLQPILREIVSKPLPVRLFLRALYVNPNKTRTELQSLCDNLDNSTTLSSNNARQILKFCNLTSNCKNCLLYMSIFPEDTFFERTRLVRRWAAEGMAVKRGRLSVLDEADHCFDLLVAHGFLTPCDMSDTGKVKGCGMDDTILEIITQIAREDHFVKNNHHPDLAHRLSVQYEGQPHQVEKELNVTRSQTCWNICGHQATIEQSNATQEFFESLPSSSHSGNLKVLDLENCNELKDHHLKNICDHAFHLKYLSLRYTNITELPKQIDKLQSLETLDIRETKVKAFAKNSIFLPKLKHLLAGHWTDEELVVNGDVQSKEMFSTVAMPKNIGDMTELQVISHIAVSGDSSELKYVGYLLQLVKLGVIVSGNTTSVLRHLYYATANLGFLRSLSIQVAETEEENENVNRKDASPIYPKFLQKLKISGLKNGLPSWVEKLKVLSKMTLHMTFITDDDFKILGRLISLSWVRLQQESCNETTLTFEKDAFQSLTFLDIKCSAITSINFDDEACPKLKKLAWFSTREQSLSGIECLPRLKELQLTGKFDMQSVKQAIKENKNFICLEAYPTRFRR